MSVGQAVSGGCALTIIPDTDGYLLSVAVENIGNRLSIQSRKLRYVRAAVEDVRKHVDELIFMINPDRDFEDHQKQRVCDQLRGAGRALAEALFADQLPDFEQLLRSHHVDQIYVTPIGSVEDLPIEFCALSLDGDNVYLGELATVIRVFAGKRYAVEVGRLVPPLPGELQPIYAEDGELGSSCSDFANPQPHEEVTTLRAIAGTDLARLSVLNTLDRATPARDQASFAEWIGKARDVIHFNSEATNIGLRVRQLANVTRHDFRSPDGLGLTQGMIVFLNACRSAIEEVQVEGSMAVEFWQAGAETVACTTWTVDDAASTAFVRAFYEELAKVGATASKAILAARQRVNRDLGHPMANLFTLVGNPNYCLSSGEA